MAIPYQDQFAQPQKLPPVSSDTPIAQQASVAVESVPGTPGTPFLQPRKKAFEVETLLSTFASRYASGVTVGVVATRICTVNSERRFAIITNDSANDMYIAFNSNPAVGGGIRLNAGGGVMIFGAMTDIPWGGEVWAITTVAGNATVIEG